MRVDLITAAAIGGVKPATVRAWARDGRVSKYPDGYDITELLLWVEQRSLAALCARAGMKDPAGAAEAVRHAAMDDPLRRPA